MRNLLLVMHYHQHWLLVCVIYILCIQIPPRKKTQKIINSSTRENQGPPQPDKAEQERKSKVTPAVGQNITHGPRVTNAKHRTEAMKVQSESNRSDSCVITQQKESVVCLTQEQFQQILSTINSTSAAIAQHDPNTHSHTGEHIQ